MRDFWKRAKFWKRIARLERKVGINAEELSAAFERCDRMAGELAAANDRVTKLLADTLELQRLQRVATVMDWIARATLKTRPLISVILPTRDRADFLARAIRSLEAQSYGNWEAVIVDDGSSDGTGDYLDGLTDARFRTLRSAGIGASAARNIALAEARGELIAYLDDDNIMHPEWLKSVVWAFEQRPESNVLYGAFTVEDFLRIDPREVSGGEFPRLYFYPYDHKGVVDGNIADMGCIAHRAGLSEGHFDESLCLMGDWDLFLRLTRDETPISLPAIACYYMLDAPNRLTGGPTSDADMAKVREKNRR